MPDTFDVFLSFHNRDREVVRLIAVSLKDCGACVWIDEDELRPGLPWQDGLQDAIRASKAAAVFLGQHGFGDWQRSEIRALLDRMAHDGLPVIPVLLPGAPAESQLGDFLSQNTWVDFRKGVTRTGLARLYWGVTGKRPQQRPMLVSGPPAHNLPFGSIGDLLKGRDKELACLSTDLDDEGSAVVIAQSRVISGLGGIGKTRLAIEYVWRTGYRYAAVWFARADSPESLRSSLAALAAPACLNLPEYQAARESEIVAAVLRTLQNNIGWLLILDNVDTEDAATAVTGALPLLSNGRILITSRLDQWPAVVRTTVLTTIAREQAADFLLQRTDGKRSQLSDDRETARQLSELLGDLPLALEQAAAFIAYHHMTLQAYLADWQIEREKVFEWYNPRVMQYPTSVAVTWNRTFRQLCVTAKAILRLSAFLAAEPIQEGLFEDNASHVLRAESFLGAEVGNNLNQHSLREAFAELAAYSMISRQDGNIFVVHRLVQEVLKNQISEERRHEWIGEVLKMVEEFAPAQPDDVRTWPVWEPLRPHVAAILSHADFCNIAAQAGNLYNELAILLYAKGLFVEAEALYRRALSLDEVSFGSNHKRIGVRLNNLATLLRIVDRLPEAERYMRRAVEIAEQGDDEPWLAILTSNLATVIERQGASRYEEAEQLFRRAIYISESCLDASHPDNAVRLNNLGHLLCMVGRYSEAEGLLLRALSIHENAEGPNHPNTAAVLDNLAAVLSGLSRLAEAESLQRRALAIKEASLGKDHLSVSISLNNLGKLLNKLDKFAEAESILIRALEIAERLLGSTHPDVLIVRRHLHVAQHR